MIFLLTESNDSTNPTFIKISSEHKERKILPISAAKIYAIALILYLLTTYNNLSNFVLKKQVNKIPNMEILTKIGLFQFN